MNANNANIFLPPQHLKKSPVATGGVCRPVAFRKEDVLTWPVKNPQTGIIHDALELKPGGLFYILEAVEKERIFLEEPKSDNGGPYFEISFQGTLAGDSTNNALSIESWIFHEWGLILPDRAGHQRLVGNEDSCCDFAAGYTSGDNSTSRKRSLKFSWQSPLPAPIYLAQAITLAIGQLVVQAGTLQLVQRFRVGAPGAPMVDGDTVYTHPLLQNKHLLFIVTGVALPVDDLTGAVDWTGSIDRHVIKAFNSNSVTVFGGVVGGEVIEVYVWI